jgi:FkbM family methyltransferase
MADPRVEYANRATGALAAAGRTPTRPIEFRSQCGEDALIWDALSGQLDGFYIEVGAFDGMTLSATYALDCIGWQGLLIEPIPERYEQCVRNRPRARVVHAAVGAPGSPRTIEFNVTDDQWGGMLSSVGKGLGQPGAVASTRVVEVPYRTMDELLEGHQGEVDVAVLDVEGHELELLRGFDLGQWRPKVLFIEQSDNDAPLIEYMKAQPYMMLMVQVHNRVYVRNDLPPPP